MIVELKHNGILIYETVNGHLFQMFYDGYTVEESKRQFKLDCKNKRMVTK